MTIVKITDESCGDNQVRCQWFDAKGALHEESFSDSSIRDKGPVAQPPGLFYSAGGSRRR
jgi:hypothetical protein